MSAPNSEAAREAVHLAQNALRYQAVPMPRTVADRAGKHVKDILNNSNVRNVIESFGYRIGNGIGIEHAAIIMLEDTENGSRYVEVRNPNRYHDKSSDRIVSDTPILRIREDGVFVVEQGGKEEKVDSPEIPLPDYLQF